MTKYPSLGIAYIGSKRYLLNCDQQLLSNLMRKSEVSLDYSQAILSIVVDLRWTNLPAGQGLNQLD